MMISYWSSFDEVYFQYDVCLVNLTLIIYRCKGMMLLETYTTLSPDELKLRLPDFLKLGPEVTGEPAFSMYNLTLKGGWIDNANFCHKLSDDKEEQERQVGTIYIFDIISFIL